MENDAREAVEAFIRYTHAFQSLDPRAPGPHFHLPSLMANPQGVFVFENEAAVEQAYRRVMAELPGIGYARSVFSNLSGRGLGRDLAVVTGRGIWENAAGKELSRFEVAYTFLRTGGVWKILTALIYPPDASA